MGSLRGTWPVRAPRRLVVPECRGRDIVHAGAHRRMSSIDDLLAAAPPANGTPTKFPAAPYASAASYFGAYTEEIARAVGSIKPSALDRAAAILLEAYTRGAGVFSCGNGGPASIANHMQCNHLKRVRTTTERSPRRDTLDAHIELRTANP